MAQESRDARGTTAVFGDIYPGEAVALSTGEVLTVSPLSAHAVIHEVPALIGKLMGKIGPYREQLKDGDVPPELLAVGAAELAQLVCHVTGLDPKRLSSPPPEGIWAEEAVDLLLALMRQNRGFFAKLSEVLAFARSELGSSGRASSPRSSGQGSESTS